MSVKYINLSDDLKQQLDKQTLGLKNRKQKKLIISAFPREEYDIADQIQVAEVQQDEYQNSKLLQIQIESKNSQESRDTKISAEATSFLD